MHRIGECAREAGYLTDHRPFVADDEIDYLPRNEVLLLCTGSQGEPRAALWRVARGDWPTVALERGDAAVFSSRIIPGNETALFELQKEPAEESGRASVVDRRGQYVWISVGAVTIK